MCEPVYFSTCEKPWNDFETLKQFVSEFYFSFISHVRASEIKLFIPVLFHVVRAALVYFIDYQEVLS